MSLSPTKDDRLWTTPTVNFKSILFFLYQSIQKKKNLYSYKQIYLLLDQFGLYKVINERFGHV